jgi:hypothetical protein
VVVKNRAASTPLEEIRGASAEAILSRWTLGLDYRELEVLNGQLAY